jgi:hypothetical protein
MLSAEEKYKRYDKRTNKKMAEHNRSGGSVAKPVRDVAKASPARKLTRGKFLLRKATQILKQSQPLKDKQGRPTPAAMQFKRWDAPIPSNYDSVRRLKQIGQNIVKRYKKD